MATQGGRWSKKGQNLVNVVCGRPLTQNMFFFQLKKRLLRDELAEKSLRNYSKVRHVRCCVQVELL